MSPYHTQAKFLIQKPCVFPHCMISNKEKAFGTDISFGMRKSQQLIISKLCNKVLFFEKCLFYQLYCFRFLSRPMLYAYNHHRFKKLELNTHFNSEKIVLENFFHAMIYLAFKYDSLVMARYLNKAVNVTVVQTVMQNVVYYYSYRASEKLKELKGKYRIIKKYIIYQKTTWILSLIIMLFLKIMSSFNV